MEIPTFQPHIRDYSLRSELTHDRERGKFAPKHTAAASDFKE